MAVAASESIDGASDATQLEGLVNRTRWPTLGPKHKRPVIAAGFRIVPQLPYPTLAASLRDPVSCPTFCASSSRVITEPLRASPMDCRIASIEMLPDQLIGSRKMLPTGAR